jgi:hypothetical protein
VGRPVKKLLKGVRVRLKNKGAKKKSGRPRKNYQVPVPKHPETDHVVNEAVKLGIMEVGLFGRSCFLFDMSSN